jgi:hypothetical protein
MLSKIKFWFKSLFQKKVDYIDFTMSDAPRAKSRKTEFEKYVKKIDGIRRSYK